MVTGQAGCRALLPRATGQPGDVLGEALCREFQPFYRRKIREDRIPESLCCHAVLDGEHGGLDAVRAFRRQDLRAEQAIGLSVRHQLEKPTRVTRRKCPRNLVEGRDRGLGF